MATPLTKSFKHKLLDFGFIADSFKDDNGKQIDYLQVVLQVELDGEVENIVLSGKTAPSPRLLRSVMLGASTIEKQEKLLSDEELRR